MGLSRCALHGASHTPRVCKAREGQSFSSAKARKATRRALLSCGHDAAVDIVLVVSGIQGDVCRRLEHLPAQTLAVRLVRARWGAYWDRERGTTAHALVIRVGVALILPARLP